MTPCHQTFIASYLNVMLCESYMQSDLVIFSLQTDSVRPWPWMESVWRKRKAFTFHRIHWMCHYIKIHANHWTQIHILQNSLNVPLHRNPRKPVDSNTSNFPYVESMITSIIQAETMNSHFGNWMTGLLHYDCRFMQSIWKKQCFLLSMKSTMPDVIWQTD